jgi:hypothetical protein
MAENSNDLHVSAIINDKSFKNICSICPICYRVDYQVVRTVQ